MDSGFFVTMSEVDFVAIMREYIDETYGKSPPLDVQVKKIPPLYDAVDAAFTDLERRGIDRLTIGFVPLKQHDPHLRLKHVYDSDDQATPQENALMRGQQAYGRLDISLIGGQRRLQFARRSYNWVEGKGAIWVTTSVETEKVGDLWKADSCRLLDDLVEYTHFDEHAVARQTAVSIPHHYANTRRMIAEYRQTGTLPPYLPKRIDILIAEYSTRLDNPNVAVPLIDALLARNRFELTHQVDGALIHDMTDLALAHGKETELVALAKRYQNDHRYDIVRDILAPLIQRADTLNSAVRKDVSTLYGATLLLQNKPSSPRYDARAAALGRALVTCQVRL
jgi:hypothetical protein